MIFFFVVVLPLIIIGFVKLYQKKSEDRRASIEREKAIAKYSNLQTLIELDKQRFQEERQALIDRLGNITVEIRLGKFRYAIDSYLFVFDQSNVLLLYAKEYKFSDILGFSLVDDATSETITASSGSSKTSTGNMLGRMAIGAVALGGVGAIVGASTAKRNISVNSTSQTTTTHKYRLYINVNSLENPTISVLIGEDSQKAYQLANLFNVIVERGRT